MVGLRGILKIMPLPRTVYRRPILMGTSSLISSMRAHNDDDKSRLSFVILSPPVCRCRLSLCDQPLISPSRCLTIPDIVVFSLLSLIMSASTRSFAISRVLFNHSPTPPLCHASLYSILPPPIPSLYDDMQVVVVVVTTSRTTSES